MVRPALIVHCDWSTSPSKRWMATARLTAKGGYEIAAAPCKTPDPLFSELRREAPRGGILVGFDFVIGLPLQYACRAGLSRFPDALLQFGRDSWEKFYEPARTFDEICLKRPFYPRAPGGTSKRQLTEALGVKDPSDLLRRCERRTALRPNACELFWTLGAKQVGRAAIHGWRDLLAPAMREGSIALWPFDGELSPLLERGGIVVAETYPAETYGLLGIAAGFGKRNWEKRKMQARAILGWCESNTAGIGPGPAAVIENGFGDTAAGEDSFDAFVGLLGMIESVKQDRGEPAPADPAIRNIEGWILGLDPAQAPFSDRRSLPRAAVR